jgi:hypothetical protein
MASSDSEDDFLKSLTVRGPNDDEPFGSLSPSRATSPSGGITPPPLGEDEEDNQHGVPPTQAIDPTLAISAATTAGSGELTELVQRVK